MHGDHCLPQRVHRGPRPSAVKNPPVLPVVHLHAQVLVHPGLDRGQRKRDEGGHLHSLHMASRHEAMESVRQRVWLPFADHDLRPEPGLFLHLDSQRTVPIGPARHVPPIASGMTNPRLRYVKHRRCGPRSAQRERLRAPATRTSRTNAPRADSAHAPQHRRRPGGPSEPHRRVRSRE